MADPIRRAERTSPPKSKTELLTQFQIKLVQALAAKVRWASNELERAKVAETPQRALDLLNPVTAALTIVGHYDNIQVVHEEQVQALQHKLLGATTVATLMQRHGLDLEDLARMDQTELRRWVSADAAQAVQELFSDPDVRLARQGILDTKRYACLDPLKGADTEHLKSVNVLLGAKLKEPVDVAEAFYQGLSQSADPVEQVVGAAVDGAWKRAVKARRAAVEGVEVAGRYYAGGTGQGARLGQAAVFLGDVALQVVGAPVLAIDPAASDAARGGAVVDSALLVLGAAGSVGRSYGLAGAGGQGQALLGRVAKLSGELQAALRPLAELDQALRRSSLGRRVDELAETLNPRLFEPGRSASSAVGDVAPTKTRDPEPTLPEVEVSAIPKEPPQPSATGSTPPPLRDATPQVGEIHSGAEVSAPALTRPIDEGDVVDIAESLKAMAQRDAREQIMRALPTEILPRAQKPAGRRASLADEAGLPASTTEATAVGDLAGPKGTFLESTWPNGPGPRGAFSEPTATGPFWERPAQPAAKPPSPAKQTRAREATPTQQEVQDNLQPAPPEPEAAPTSPTEAPTEAPTFRIGARKGWTFANLGAGPGALGSA
ncbi:MAG: hypothetical protein IPG45_18795 [Deltaproteobacteria bacterium]|nr:hypothetical protein [Deltaproteobacteria bacterium]